MDSFARSGLTFDVTDTGPAGGPVAVLLHGFPQDRSCWTPVAERLAADGIRSLAPDQRGYSPRATPAGRSAYATKELVGDVRALIDASGADKVHLVGHDWGGGVAWAVAQSTADRLASLTVVSTPHPAALIWAIRHGGQWRKSWYMGAFQLPWLPERIVSRRVESLLAGSGAPAEDARRYADRFRAPASLTGPINWYRGMFAGGVPKGGQSQGSGKITVPTTYLWGRHDFALGEAAALKTAEYVSAPYEFVEVDGGHWLPETHPELISRAVAEAVRGRSDGNPHDPRA